MLTPILTASITGISFWVVSSVISVFCNVLLHFTQPARGIYISSQRLWRWEGTGCTNPLHVMRFSMKACQGTEEIIVTPIYHFPLHYFFIGCLGKLFVNSWCSLAWDMAGCSWCLARWTDCGPDGVCVSEEPVFLAIAKAGPNHSIDGSCVSIIRWAVVTPLRRVDLSIGQEMELPNHTDMPLVSVSLMIVF